MLPNFFVVGAQKAATTSLHYYLADHPEIFLPKQKETHFFVQDELYQKGLDYYEDTFFTAWSGEPVVGEVDPDYMFFPEALSRISSHFDVTKLKFIFLFRNPVERAFSHYLMSYRRAIEPYSFECALNSEQSRIKEGFYNKEHYSYMNRGFYYQQVKPFLALAPNENILYLLSEDLKHNREIVIKQVYEFLGVSSAYSPHISDKKYNEVSLPKSLALVKKIRENSLEKKFVKALIPWEGVRKKIASKILQLNTKKKVDIVLESHLKHKLAKIYELSNNDLAKLINRDLTHWNSWSTNSPQQEVVA